MKVLNLIQGSQEWLDVRLTHFTASDASAMMGSSKYKTRTQLLKEKKGWKEEVSASKQALFNKGHEAEEKARIILEETMLDPFNPIVGSLNYQGVPLMASLDGLSECSQIIFEHKLWNETLAENVRNNVLEESHYWQLEHQLLVCDSASKVLFVVSDGTKEKKVFMWYESSADRRQALIDGWKQFKKDLDGYTLEAKKEVVSVVGAKNYLPTLSYKVTGSEIATNIDICLEEIKTLASDEMSKVLETDQDFADKDQLNKDVKKARAALKDATAKIKGEFVSFSQFEEIASEMDSVLQKMQSHGEKQVKQAKEDKKKAIIKSANDDLQSFLLECNAKVSPLNISLIVGNVNPDFIGTMKGKRTIDSLESGVSDLLAETKIEINKIVDRVVDNLSFANEASSNHKFLFSDFNQLVSKEVEDFQAVVKSRISEHEEAEAIRLEAERERIQKEEEAKAQREAEARAEAERERIRKEERAKAQAEEQAKREAEAAERLKLEEEARIQREEEALLAKEKEPEVVEEVFEIKKGGLTQSMADKWPEKEITEASAQDKEPLSMNMINKEDEAVFNDVIADAKPVLESVSEIVKAHCESDLILEAKNNLIYSLTKEAARSGFIDFLEAIEVTEEQYEAIKAEWIEQGIKPYC